MSDGTTIEWTDATVNAINGCAVVSPGCSNCYAMRLAGTRMKHHPTRAGLTVDTKGGPVWTGEVRLNETALIDPLRWQRHRRIFWNAHGDMFHENVPDKWIAMCLAVAALTPRHTHQFLTKRSKRMRDWLSRPEARADVLDAASYLARSTEQAIIAHTMPWPLPHVWLGVSVEDQQRADERIPDLLATPAAIRFLSCEPLLGPINLEGIWVRRPDGSETLWNVLRKFAGQRVDWVIVGGESGPETRMMHPDWARSILEQCATAGVPFFMKQMTRKAPIPVDLQFREMPA